MLIVAKLSKIGSDKMSTTTQKPVLRGQRSVSIEEHDFVEQLVCANNHFGKSLTLLSMRLGRRYTNSELYTVAADMLGVSKPFESQSAPYDYCRYSLEGMGFVQHRTVPNKAEFGKRWLRAFELTPYGELFGKPSAVKFLTLADSLNLSLKRLNGSTNTPGGTRRGYVVARILEALYGSTYHTLTDLSNAVGISISVISEAMKDLREIGLVMHKAEITKEGRLAFDTAYGPILKVARSLESKTEKREFSGIVRDIGARRIIELLRSESERYKTEAVSPAVSGRRNETAVLGLRQTFKQSQFGFPRLKEALRRSKETIGLNIRDDSSITNIIKRLTEKGLVARVGEGVYRFC